MSSTARAAALEGLGVAVQREGVRGEALVPLARVPRVGLDEPAQHLDGAREVAALRAHPLEHREGGDVAGLGLDEAREHALGVVEAAQAGVHLGEVAARFEVRRRRAKGLLQRGELRGEHPLEAPEVDDARAGLAAQLAVVARELDDPRHDGDGGVELAQSLGHHREPLVVVELVGAQRDGLAVELDGLRRSCRGGVHLGERRGAAGPVARPVADALPRGEGAVAVALLHQPLAEGLERGGVGGVVARDELGLAQGGGLLADARVHLREALVHVGVVARARAGLREGGEGLGAAARRARGRRRGR